MDAAGKDYVLIETVGVGQDEIEIARLARLRIVVLRARHGRRYSSHQGRHHGDRRHFRDQQKRSRGADRVEQQLHAMLSLVMPQHGWHPPVVRTVASENRGVDALAATIAKFREHFATRPESRKKHVEHWKKRLVELLESRLLERALGNAAGEAQLTELAAAVAERRKDPFTAVNEILARSGLVA